MKEKLANLFPTVESIVIFICYIVFSIGQGILVQTSGRKEDGYDYNTVTVVLLTETLKLFLAYLCYIKENSFNSLCQGIRSNLKIFCLYLVPSFLYCFYNNLAFINLSHFDPTSYFILLQLRVVITGILFQIVFKKKLSKLQWLSLAILTCGCMIQQLDWDHVKSALWGSGESLKEHSFLSIYLFFIFIQTLCSCFAGVYNELLLKGVGGNVNIFIQNMFMYLDSIFWNLVVLCFQGNLKSTFTWGTLQPILRPSVLILIFNNSLMGITTSLFLKSLDSILKIFASAMELLFTALLSWLILGIEINLNTIIAIVLISNSFYVYSRNPVNSQKNKTEANKVGEKTSPREVV